MRAEWIVSRGSMFQVRPPLIFDGMIPLTIPHAACKAARMATTHADASPWMFRAMQDGPLVWSCTYWPVSPDSAHLSHCRSLRPWPMSPSTGSTAAGGRRQHFMLLRLGPDHRSLQSSKTLPKPHDNFTEFHSNANRKATTGHANKFAYASGCKFPASVGCLKNGRIVAHQQSAVL